MLRNIFILGAGMLLFSACSENIPQVDNVNLAASTNVIYGEDDRADLHEVKNPIVQEIAQSTVALVQGHKLIENGDSYVLNGHNYGQTNMLCRDEKFYEQDAAAYCSGSLIGDDLILTAGHCIETCGNEKFVFGFSKDSKDRDPNIIAKEDVYSCEKVIMHRLDTEDGMDFAVVRLDRKVTDRRPLEVRTQGKPRIGEKLYVIGHPSGLPSKFADGASIRSYDQNKPYFVANLDTYGGNSGSAVFNEKTHQIEGVLVRGEQDFEIKNGCRVSKRCADHACMGEHVTKVTTIFN